MSADSKRYVVEMLASLAAYTLILVAVNLVYDRWEGGPESAWRYLLAILPMIPAFLSLSRLPDTSISALRKFSSTVQSMIRSGFRCPHL